MSVSEAAIKLGLKPWTVRHKANKSQLVPAVKRNGEWDITEAAIVSYRARQSAEGANEGTLALMKKGLVTV